MTSSLQGSRCDVLVIHSEDVQAVKFSKRMVDLCGCVDPRKKLVVKPISEKKLDKSLLVADKILFLLSGSSGDFHRDMGRWMTVFPEYSRQSSFSVLVVHEMSSSSEAFSYKFCDEAGELSVWRIVNVKMLKDVFQWWPEVIHFVYDLKEDIEHQSKPHKSAASQVSPSPKEVKPLLDEQHQLKQDLDRLTERYHKQATQRRFRALTQPVISVAFGRDITIPFYAHACYRKAKINYGKVLFFFTTEIEFHQFITDLSTHTFYPGQYMEGILVLICVLTNMEFTDRQPSKPLDKPKGPLFITDRGLFWGRMQAMGNCSLSLQRREPESGEWTEIDPRVPLFQFQYTLRRSTMDATKEFRLVKTDESGQLSEPLSYSESSSQYMYRKCLAMLIALLIFPNVCLTIAFAPFVIGAFVVFKRRKDSPWKVTSLERNNELAGVIYWSHCTMAILIGALLILLQHIYNSFNSILFWNVLLFPFVLVCSNYMIRGLFSRYAKHSLVTSTVPGYMIPPVDVCYAFWNNPFMSFSANCCQRNYDDA